jgi:hypothetical protein
VLAYQTELGTGMMVIVTTVVTDADVVEVEGSLGRLPHPVMVQVEVKVTELELDGLAGQLAQPVKDVDEEPELVAIGFAGVLAEPEPVAKPLQVLVVQVPNVDQSVGVENVEDEVTPELELVDDEVDAAPTGVELELVLQALPQAQVEDEDGEVALELELVVVLEVVDRDTGMTGLETEELEVEEYELVQLELVVVLEVVDRDTGMTGLETEELEVEEYELVQLELVVVLEVVDKDTGMTGLDAEEAEVEEYELVQLELVVVLEVVDRDTGLAGLDTEEVEVEEYELVQLELVAEVVLVVEVDRVVEVDDVVLDVVLELVIGRPHELPVNSGLMFCA